jgi:hypothetical protein
MDKIGRPLFLKFMPPLLEAPNGSRLRELFARKNQNYIASFITECLSGGETIPPHDPPHIQA